MTDTYVITVTGGSGGIAANTDDLARAAGTISRALTSVGQACRGYDGVAAIAVDLTRDAAQHPVHSGVGLDVTGRAALHRLVDATVGLRSRSSRLQTRLEELSEKVRAAAASYEEAEARSRSAVRDLAGWVPNLLGPGAVLFRGQWDAAVVAGDPARTPRERAVAGFAAWAGRMNPFRNPFRTADVGDVAGMLSVGWSAATRLVGPGHRRELRPGFLSERTEMAPRVESLTDAATAIRSLPSETVMIQKHDQPDGRVTWSVFIKGTEDLGLSDNVFGLGENFKLMSGQRSAGMDLVDAAMRQAGIPPGADVGFYGHSQGGIIAMALADDRAIRDRYNLTNVTTYGSPVAGFVLADPIPTLHIDNNQEYVSDLDGAAAVDTPEKTTITADLPEGHAKPHSLDTHAQVLQEAQYMGDRSVDDAIALQTENLASPGEEPPLTDSQGGRMARDEVEVETQFFSPGQSTSSFVTPPAAPRPIAPSDGAAPSGPRGHRTPDCGRMPGYAGPWWGYWRGGYIPHPGSEMVPL